MTVSLQGIDVSKDKLLQMYTSMMRIRKFEEKIISFYTLGKLPSFPHAYIFVAWMCWVPNFLIAEWLVRHHSTVAAI